VGVPQQVLGLDEPLRGLVALLLHDAEERAVGVGLDAVVVDRLRHALQQAGEPDPPVDDGEVELESHVAVHEVEERDAQVLGPQDAAGAGRGPVARSPAS
jgi:hypothetical protein